MDTDDVTDGRQAPIPHGVRATMPDGEVIPLDLVCIGFRRGKWRWVSAWPLRGQPRQVDYDYMPDDTTILVNSARPHGV